MQLIVYFPNLCIHVCSNRLTENIIDEPVPQRVLHQNPISNSKQNASRNISNPFSPLPQAHHWTSPEHKYAHIQYAPELPT